MKKLPIILLLVEIAAIVVFFGLTFWHFQEENAICEWKIKCLGLSTEIEKKRKENNWTWEEAKTYGDKLKDSLGVVYPTKCPYCYCRTLMMRYGAK